MYNISFNLRSTENPYLFIVGRALIQVIVLRSCGCCNKAPQIQWFKTIEIILSSSAGSVSEIEVFAGFHSLWRLQRRIPSLSLATSGGCRHSVMCGHIIPVSDSGPVAAASSVCLKSSSAFLL